MVMFESFSAPSFGISIKSHFAVFHPNFCSSLFFSPPDDKPSGYFYKVRSYPFGALSGLASPSGRAGFCEARPKGAVGFVPRSVAWTFISSPNGGVHAGSPLPHPPHLRSDLPRLFQLVFPGADDTSLRSVQALHPSFRNSLFTN
jgi:hypothetical protein